MNGASDASAFLNEASDDFFFFRRGVDALKLRNMSYKKIFDLRSEREQSGFYWVSGGNHVDLFYSAASLRSTSWSSA